MELRQIEYFIKVYELKSYTKAAQLLNVSQPAITMAIKRLEEELGLFLFLRDNKGLVITKAGEALLPHAKNILLELENFIKISKDFNINKKKLQISFPSTLGSWLWEAIYRDFSVQYPDVEIETNDKGTMEIIKDVKDGVLELGFCVIENEQDSDLEIKVIKEGELKIIMSLENNLASHEVIPLEKLSSERIIMYKKDTTYTEKFIRSLLNESEIKPEFIYVREQSTVFDLVIKNLGVSFILDDTSGVLNNNKKIEIKGTDKKVSFRAGLIWNKERHLSSTARAFIEFLSSYENELLYK